MIELVGGYLTGSVAIVADAVHDLGDSVSLGLAVYLQKKSAGTPTAEFSYGYRRLSLMSAVITGVVLICGSLVIGAAALERLVMGTGVPNGKGMLMLAVLGVLVNGVAAWRLSHGRTHNERMLTWHLLEDFLGWIAVLVGALLIWQFGWNWIDSALAVGISLFIAWNALRNLNQAVAVFLQKVPEGLNSSALREKLTAVPGVTGVHDLHVWSMDGERHVVSLHAVVKRLENLAELKAKIRSVAREFGSFHTTIELESSDELCAEDCEQDHSKAPTY